MITLPDTNLKEVLYDLIQYGNVSIETYYYMPGFRTRVSELRKLGVEIESRSFFKVNKFGREYRYLIHYLKNKEFSISLYRRI